MALHRKKSRKNIWAPVRGPTKSGSEGLPSQYTSPETVSDERFINMLLGAMAVAREINQFESEPTTSKDSEETTKES